MVQHTTSLLRSIWASSAWRDELLTTFERWMQEGATRREVKSALKAIIEADLPQETTFDLPDVSLGQVSWDQMTEFLCLCCYRKRWRSPLPEVPPDTIWAKLSDEHIRGLLSYHPQQERAIKDTIPVPLVPLEQKLLALGGRRMIYRDEPHLKLLLERGEVFDGPAELMPGEPRDCHGNAARLWDEKRDTLAIVTGYALSEDGLWRQHSWLARKRPAPGQDRLIETTIERVKYFGCMLNDAEAEEFLRA